MARTASARDALIRVLSFQSRFSGAAGRRRPGFIYTSELMAHEAGNLNINLEMTRVWPQNGVMPKQHPPRISRHAVERYLQRVSCVPPTEAARRLAELSADSTRRPTPRRWTKVRPGPGVLFLYPRADSDICLLMKGDTITTVFSRDVCRRWRDERRGTWGRWHADERSYQGPSPRLSPGEEA